jgi:hypothetical protein
MAEDLLLFGVSLVAATPYLVKRAEVEIHDQDLGQRLVRRVMVRAWNQRQSRPSDKDLIPWLLTLLDQEKETEAMQGFSTGRLSTLNWRAPSTQIQA